MVLVLFVFIILQNMDFSKVCGLPCRHAIRSCHVHRSLPCLECPTATRPRKNLINAFISYIIQLGRSLTLKPTRNFWTNWRQHKKLQSGMQADFNPCHLGFDWYGHTDTDTDMVIPIYSKPIPIPILPSKIHQTDTDTDNRYIPILNWYHTDI